MACVVYLPNIMNIGIFASFADDIGI